MVAASDFVRNCARILFIPFIFFFIICSWIVYWIISALWVYSVGDAEKDGISPIANIEWDYQTR
jgi:hypothetical protein